MAYASYPFCRPYRKSETLGDPAKRFAEGPRTLGAVYDLKRCPAHTSVSIEEVRGIEKFKVFHYSTLIDFHCMKQERLRFFSQMAQEIPVYQVQLPWDISKLEEVYDAIIAHCS